MHVNFDKYARHGIIARMSLAPGLLEILACPCCKGELRLTPAGDGLGCLKCRVTYPIVDDIPVMIFEEAVPWAPGDGQENA